jgi:multidrug efflux pump
MWSSSSSRTRTSSTALEDVRSKVDDAKREFPSGTDEPSVNEVNISEFPILVVTLSGNAPERVTDPRRQGVARQIEEVGGVLEAKLQGSRDEMVEVIIDPVKLSSYNLQLDQLIGGVRANNQLVAAGTLEGEEGKYAVKVPALIETVEDIANLPIAASGNAVVRARDLATIRSTFEDRLHRPAERQAGDRDRGVQALRREPDRDVDGVKAAAEEFKSLLPAGVESELQPGQVQGHPHDARGSAELGADRGDPGLHRHPVFPRYPVLDPDRPGDPDLVPDGHPGAVGGRASRSISSCCSA